ncbi:probable leucine-rich repeat receptor-like protein kinase at5g49770 [Phtheirospermum japonicum]|uniref:Probable leucine-rich repeat receptor-like protein kinase at5g49770 n=1 Tax=Phtheirospermum japonicum TaxID=374723 RepID=A0A830BCJ2_9LAMI|nr:probable leucine-rich repeat receptor-like protein kinase at5g49770 [Phtheirospermum japonicum]
MTYGIMCRPIGTELIHAEVTGMESDAMLIIVSLPCALRRLGLAGAPSVNAYNKEMFAESKKEINALLSDE